MTLSLSACRPAVEMILDRVHAGIRLTAQDASLFAQTTSSEFLALLQTADALRAQYHSDTITYSRKVFIPLTNLCRDYCGYCTFRRDPGDPGAKTMTPDDVLEVVTQGEKLGCKEALFSLGDKPEALFPETRQELQRLGHRRMLGYLAAMCRLVLDNSSLFPHANPGVMGPKDLERLRDVNISMGLMLESTSRRLLGKGLAHDNAPDKDPAVRLKTLENAGKLRIPFTTGILIGIGETFAERVDALCAIRDLHDRYGHIQEVIIQNFRAKPAIPMHAHPEPTLLDFLRTIAVARLILGGEMNIQAPPNLTPEQYQLLIAAGINDWGGVSPVTIDFINPEAPWPQLRTLAHVSAEMGLRLRQRLALYPEYITRKPDFIAPALVSRLHGTVDADGYPLVQQGDALP